MRTINVESYGFSCDVASYQETVNTKHNDLVNKTGKGNDFLGWVTLPNEITKEEIQKIKTVAKQLKDQSDAVVVIGIGGSYLGLKMAEEFLRTSFKSETKLYYAGHTMSSSYMKMLLEELEDQDFSIIVISKSGTTTEPAIAFRMLYAELQKRYSDVSKRVVAITDANRGALRTLATEEGFETFVIPDDVGGRYSVLTPVGLLGLAVIDVDIDALIQGAKDAVTEASNPDLSTNIAYQYAVLRNDLYKNGKSIELLVNYEPQLIYFSEWWKQLFGESEGKDGKGLFPASVSYSTDLHSMGQYVQDGERILFETIIHVASSDAEFIMGENEKDLDGLNYLSGKSLFEVNEKAMEGTMKAHLTGNVPQIKLTIPNRSAHTLGNMIYFFEVACGISGYLLDVNPFDQPGVEEYKRNMFELLGKPGY